MTRFSEDKFAPTMISTAGVDFKVQKRVGASSDVSVLFILMFFVGALVSYVRLFFGGGGGRHRLMLGREENTFLGLVFCVFDLSSSSWGLD